MRVFGVDFTSGPSASTSKAKAAKWMTVARCTFDSTCLWVQSLDPLNRKKDDYSNLSTLLTAKGPWIVGIDVPFGMPIECIEYFQWLKKGHPQSWATYVDRCRDLTTRKAFKSLIESWRHPTRINASGGKERVRKYRLVDRLIKAQSPMNCVRPAVGSMFFEACKIIKESPASVPPVRTTKGEERVVVEAYPRLVADRFIGGTPYKEAYGLDGQRKLIVDGITSNNPDGAMIKWYGFHVGMNDELATECIEDRDGDRLDSVLSAVQAAWASRQKDFGMPDFLTTVMRDAIALEGWVPDPFVERLTNGTVV